MSTSWAFEIPLPDASTTRPLMAASPAVGPVGSEKQNVKWLMLCCTPVTRFVSLILKGLYGKTALSLPTFSITAVIGSCELHEETVDPLDETVTERFGDSGPTTIRPLPVVKGNVPLG